MIAFPDDMPLIVMANGQAVAFDRAWLMRALHVAAQRAGYAKWWLASHVAESVQLWLRDLPEVRVMPVARFARAVRAALQVIGYAEIGERFEAAAPFARISLVELAQAAGGGYELVFFSTLGQRLREVMQLGSGYCELVGIEPCVRLLRGRRGWGRDCDSLRAEIVIFAREQTGRACMGEGAAAAARDIFLHVA